MTFRYIGSKSSLIGQITTYMGHPKWGAFFVDAVAADEAVADRGAGQRSFIKNGQEK